MEELENAIAEINVTGCETPGSIQKVRSAVSVLKGVESVSFESGVLHITYCPHRVLLSFIEEQITAAGFHIRKPAGEKKIGLFRKFLDRLAESNEKTFGSKPLDCCTVGREKKKLS